MRSVNQDAVLAGPELFVVADGMGGHAAGDVASSIAIATIAAAADDGGGLTTGAVLRVVEQANLKILEAANEGEQRDGMGTTVALVARCIDRGAETLLVANVGDSRVYEWSSGGLTQLSVDHSVVGELLAAGDLTADEARTHPERHTITRALGLVPGMDVEWRTRIPVPGARYLVCSDGLTNEVEDVELADLLGAGHEAAVDAQALLDLALDRGARDNVSVVIVDVGEVQPWTGPGGDAPDVTAGHATRPSDIPTARAAS